MSEVLVRRRHRLGLAQATELAEQMARRLRVDFGGSYAWESGVLRFQRPGASGHVAVTRPASRSASTSGGCSARVAVQ